jgi:hypothetical protein
MRKTSGKLGIPIARDNRATFSQLEYRFRERPEDEEWVGLPNSLVIEVNDVTGETSHIDSL